jgi:hypothetical protein
VMADQSIAIVRGREYRVDWVGADKRMTQGPPIEPNQKRLTESDKARIADSINTARNARADARIAKGITDSLKAVAAGDARAAAAATRSARLTAGMERRDPPTADDIPNYLPRIAEDAELFTVMPDFANNLWIQRRETGEARALIYDVVNRQGQRIDRVVIPAGKVLLGFQPGGFALLLAVNGGVAQLEKARIR